MTNQSIELRNEWILASKGDPNSCLLTCSIGAAKNSVLAYLDTAPGLDKLPRELLSWLDLRPVNRLE